MGRYIYKDNLETNRLRTRKLVHGDSKIWSRFFEDKEATRFLPNVPDITTETKAKHWVEKQLRRYQTKSFGLQALIEKNSGELIGMCGLLLQELEGSQEVEIGYHIFKEHWGKGYATEAAVLFKEYAIKNKLTTSLISIIDIDNIPSQKVAQKNGMVLEKQCTWHNLNVFIYRLSITS